MKIFDSARFNTELQNKKQKDPEEYWNLSKSFNQEQRQIPMAKYVLFDRFKNLESATSPDRNNYENFSCETIEKPQD